MDSQKLKDNLKEVVRLTEILEKIDLPSGEVIKLTGSIAFKEIYISPDEHYQILEVWCKDKLCTPMPLHEHPTQDEYIIMLDGNEELVWNDGTSHLINKGDIFKIPAGQKHLAIPADTMRQIVILVPPVEEYRGLHKSSGRPGKVGDRGQDAVDGVGGKGGRGGEGGKGGTV
jgi:quercetin dioxygenase-like cupin family protein